MPRTPVAAKLRPPRMRPNFVACPRLREILARNEGRRLTLVSAPAGFGKTNVLAEWPEERPEGGVGRLDLPRRIGQRPGAVSRLPGGRAPAAEVTECNCSICRRYGVLWAYYPPDRVRVLPPIHPPTSTRGATGLSSSTAAGIAAASRTGPPQTAGATGWASTRASWPR